MEIRGGIFLKIQPSGVFCSSHLSGQRSSSLTTYPEITRRLVFYSFGSHGERLTKLGLPPVHTINQKSGFYNPVWRVQRAFPKGQADSTYQFQLRGVQVCVCPEALISAER